MNASNDSRVGSAQWYTLAVLTLIYTFHTVDRNVVSAVLEPIKREFLLTDSQMGALSGLAHAIAYALAVLPLGWMVDRFSRIRVLAAVVAVWSGLTTMAGGAGSYVTLMIIRFCVGAAEAGSQPACMSLLADLFPASRRASAIGIFYLSTAFGTGLVFLLGGYIAHAFGWRAVFLAAGIPGIALTAVVLMTLREPRRGAYEAPQLHAHVQPTSVNFAGVLRHIQQSPALLWLVASISLAALVMASIWTWTIPFLSRVHGLNLKQAGLVVGITAGVCQAVGAAISGPIADRLAKTDPWRVLLVPCVTLLLAVCAGMGMLCATTANTAIICAMLLGLMLGGWLGPGFAMVLTLSPPTMRGRVMAVTQLLVNLLGVGLGPLLTGAISDWIGGPYSIRPALQIILSVDILAALGFLMVARASKAKALAEFAQE